MEDARKSKNLGFTKETLPGGTHVCHIFRDVAERSDALKAFLLAGLLGGERVGFFLAGGVELQDMDALLAEHDLDLEALEAEGRFLRWASEDVYFKQGRFEGTFDPDCPFGLFRRLREEAARAGRDIRVMGEMNPEVGRFEGGRPMIRYEEDLGLFLQRTPMTIVCQYDASEFHGAVIMDVLRVHPMMVVGDAVIHNPFFVAPASLREGHGDP